MYLSFFIITCNVHFFKDDIFLDREAHALRMSRGKMVIFLISEGKKVISF